MINSCDSSCLGRIATECFPKSQDFDLQFLAHPANEKWSLVFGHPNTRLVVGRGKDIGEKKNDGYNVIYIDRFGGAFKGWNGDSHVLWMDINLLKPLDMLPGYLLREVIVDYSTWRYLEVTRCKDAWISLLQAGGKLVFEAGVASFKIVNDATGKGIETLLDDWHFECFNPCHPVFTLHQLRYLLADDLHELLSHTLKQSSMIGFFNPRSSSKCLRFNERVIIPAAWDQSKDSQVSNFSSSVHDVGALIADSSTSQKLSLSRQELGTLLKEATSVQLVNVYRSLFSTAKVSVYNAPGYPYPIPTSKPVSRWIEVIL